ncbi:GNAT family N-acetyltransferase [Phycicoccus sp.]|uniref:GNAT family N-acetyltransferase n=1 Tax=Phycicoccus sp. TaxID=1902410 RepID=UPI002C41758D|nr:GNAT family N-acetyltransferase [Phycicoccus sp.]HMM95678.1 GNAT family N-acetyltransferase [Phycicoccus sp.]
MTPPYRVERLDPRRSRDLADLAGMRAAWAGEQSDATEEGFAARLGAWWEAQGGVRHAWVVRDAGGGAVGMANCQVFDRMPRPGRPDRRWAYVANVWTAPAHRRRGVGRLLMTELLAWCREQGLVRVVLNPSEVSLPLYRSVGFRPADDLMRLDL